jgi:hypothetical protein
MDAGPLISPLISVVTTAVISAIKDPVGRVFENRTKRLQFWKTMLETSSLTDVTDQSFLKEQCRQEIAEASDEVLKITNKFVGGLSVLLLFGIVLLILSFIVRVTMIMLHKMHQIGAPESAANQIGYISALVQAVVISIGWFWGRWKLRDWVWLKIKPGQTFDFLLKNKRLQAAAELVGLIGLFVIMRLSFYIMFSRT